VSVHVRIGTVRAPRVGNVPCSLEGAIGRVKERRHARMRTARPTHLEGAIGRVGVVAIQSRDAAIDLQLLMRLLHRFASCLALPNMIVSPKGLELVPVE
jgi:hypothetical protein